MRLSVSLVGRLAVRFNGRLVELRTQKANAVLSYLALTETKQESRERLVGLLWSRSDEEKARASLRQVVRELRSAFEDAGYSGFVAGRLSVHLDTEKAELDVDVESVIRLAESGSVHPLLLNTPRLGERILEGMDDLDPSFRIWVLAKRQTIHDRLMRNLDAGLIARRAETGAKNEIATAIVNLDPTHEEACCHLMRMHAEQGDAAGALRIYKALWDLLDRDYGMEPAPATEALVAEIKLGAFERPAGRSGAQPGSGRRAVSAGWRTLRSSRRCGGEVRRRLDQDAACAAAVCDAWHRWRSRSSCAGLRAASCGVSCALPRMDGHRPLEHHGPASVVGFGAAILHRKHRLPGRHRNQHGDGAQRGSDGCLYLERKLPAKPGQLVRGTAAHHPPDRDFAERPDIGGTADAAGR